MSRLRTRAGFTLIELLAVIAIILILVALLIPSLGRLIDNGRFVICMSNVRQMVNANVLYAGDNEGRLVGPNWVPSGDPPAERGWLTGTNANLYTGPAAVRSGLLFDYMKEERIYRCPADPQQGAAARAIYYPRDTRIMTSYIMNGSVCGYGRRPYDRTARLWDTYRLSQFRQGDFVFWEGDENLNNFGDWWDGANSPNQGISRRHYGENMVGRVDGGGERLSWDEYRAEERKSSKNRLWNVPDSSNGH